MTAYDIHGLVVRSVVPLAAPLSAAADSDVTITWGERVAPDDEPPPGQLVLQWGRPNQRGYAVSATSEGHTLRFFSLMDVRIDRAVRSVTVHPWPRATLQTAEVIMGGAVLAAVLMLRGHAVLHAGAVERDGAAIMVVGASGMGKSTVTTLLCAAGLALVTDDVLRLDLPGSGPLRAIRGSNELRLRPGAAELVERLPARVRQTPDGRTALRPAFTPNISLPAGPMLLPRPDRSATRVSAAPVAPAVALSRLLGYPRLPGWFAGPVPVEQFRAVLQVAERLAAFELTVPWGPPFAGTLHEEVLEVVASIPRRPEHAPPRGSGPTA